MMDWLDNAAWWEVGVVFGLLYAFAGWTLRMVFEALSYGWHTGKLDAVKDHPSNKTGT